MKISGICQTITAAAALCLGAGGVHATTINFNSALASGNLPQTVTTGGVVISGFTVSKTNGTVWSSNVLLDNRNEGPLDVGLGVCANIHNCPATGNGDINEIDNNGSTFDVIRFDFTNASTASFGLGSLDSGLKDGYAIFGSNTALPNLSTLTALASGTNTSAGSVTPVIAVNQPFRYFFLAPLKRGVNDEDSDYLVRSVTYAQAPEPMSAGLIGAGLIGLAILRRKTRA
jgi:hypothetical protein